MAARGGGYGSGGFRNVWLHVTTSAGTLRITASPGGTLGGMPSGNNIEVAATLTGMVDVAEGVFHASHARLLDYAPAVAGG